MTCDSIFVKLYCTISNFQYIFEKTGQLSTNQLQEIISCVFINKKQNCGYLIKAMDRELVCKIIYLGAKTSCYVHDLSRIHIITWLLLVLLLVLGIFGMYGVNNMQSLPTWG